MAFEGGIDLSTFQTDYKESCAWDIVNTTSERKVTDATVAMELSLTGLVLEPTNFFEVSL